MEDIRVDLSYSVPAEINAKLPPFLAPSSRLSGCGGAVICDKLMGLLEALLSVGEGVPCPPTSSATSK